MFFSSTILVYPELEYRLHIFMIWLSLRMIIMFGISPYKGIGVTIHAWTTEIYLLTIILLQLLKIFYGDILTIFQYVLITMCYFQSMITTVFNMMFYTCFKRNRVMIIKKNREDLEDLEDLLDLNKTIVITRCLEIRN